MYTVIEINEVGKIVNADPVEGLMRGVACTDGSEHRAGVPDLRMARHAGVCRRDSRKRRLADRRVTVLAADAEPLHMMLMTERDRLFNGNTDAGGISGTVDFNRGPGNKCQNNQHDNDTRPGNDFGAGVENLRQRIVLVLLARNGSEYVN